MSCIYSVIICICYSCLSGIALSSRESLAFTGCNAVLKWNLGMLSKFELLTTTVCIKDKNGSVIISHKENRCSSVDTISIRCIVSEGDGEIFISMIIFHVTKDHNGNFTALIKRGLNKISVEKQLIVIDKPQIMENRNPVLHESFAVTCNTAYKADCLTYHWIKNGVHQNYTASFQGDSSTLAFTNITMMDNSSMLKCQVGIEKCADVDFTNRSCSSMESNLYIVLPYYGPINVSFNLNESDIYLRENETFTVKCSANCFPECAFRWKSYYFNVEDQELIINSFVSRLSGAYTCIARNRKTGATVESNPFFLHHVKAVTVFSSPPAENQDVTVFSSPPAESHGPGPEQYWMGPIIVSVFLLVVGFVIFVTRWRKNASRGIGKRPMQLCGKAKRENNAAHDDLDTGTQSQDLVNPLQEDMYHTIDEAALSDYDYAGDDVIARNSNETGSSTRHGYYNYSHSIEMRHTETADLYITDEDYITPISDIARTIEICKNGQIDEPGTDQTIITPINEFVCPIETRVYQVEKTDVLETDHTYITPVA